jgi:hypothetical protein
MIRNCKDGCTKYADKPDRARCAIDYEVGLAYCLDGTVPVEIFERMGNGGTCKEKTV